ncbi:MAG: CDP-alcohol phosphatidyltransferase family protein [Tessaracoccus sp.]|uniref:phosphatidylinositol phosphate synthase n=1 Tax=Tessaracoccus sp. TaxID=1971211 RepID=UPI001EB40919|nr:CDP-alcohol phosphatidyltransferase family protein [Tessaracoccus sp.]MBK7822602.1 CDP-alcohol phosphatidyltransferase family protein [Tessaracoccus sp.]
MLDFLRGTYGRALTPAARLLAAAGVTPVQVTVVGTAGVVAASLTLLPLGHFLAGAIVIAVFLLGDGIDGTLARVTGRESSFGAFLDSTLDRAADAAVFSGLALWAAGGGPAPGVGVDVTGVVNRPEILWLTLACLVFGFLVSYARARAEAVGVDASVGLFERTDRLVGALLGVLAVGLGAPVWVLSLALAVVAVGSAFTVAQRVHAAWMGFRARAD